MFLIKYVKEVYKFKDFYFFLSLRNIKSLYNQTKLGILWGLINPLLTSFAFTLVGMVLKVSNDITTHFITTYTAVLPWILFRDGLLNTSESFFKDSILIKKVKFPRIILPLAGLTSKFLDFSVGLTILLILSYIKIPVFNSYIVLLPLLVMIILLSSIGIGLMVLIPSINYRDVRHLVKFVVPLFMFVSPILYSSSSIPERWISIYSYNPLVGTIEGFRAVINHTEIPWSYISKGLIVSLFIFFCGLFVFVKSENKLNDYL